MEAALAAKLADEVRDGRPLREAIVRAGLPLRATLLDLQRNHRAQFRQAKREQIERIAKRPAMVAKALDILSKAPNGR